MLPLILLLLPFLAGVAANAIKPTAYEALATFDFPPGIIPKGVYSYTLDNSTGHFAAHLNTSSSAAAVCEFSIQGSYSLRYKPTITGRVSVDRLADLQGVSVKVLFFWLNIVEVTRDGHRLGFSVGVTSADFGLENFLDSPTCGCGFDCDDSNKLVLPEPAESGVRLRGAF